MNTAFLLMAQYNGKAIIPVDVVARDYFPHLSADKFLRKTLLGEIKLPVVRIDPGTQKSAKGIHLSDLARYLDDRRNAAIKEANQLFPPGS
ncbi:pyocin activator PrtN family protein [Roseateles sp. DC23W]|uniref:Pyocin activator PrtN family protein n=1 Tax=Pelomonas dachongensis TaxID=3299029 RepID=A0ABW7EK37_9BURK